MSDDLFLIPHKYIINSLNSSTRAALYIECPRQNFRLGKFVLKGLTLKKNVKGLAVYATEFLTKGLRIPYEGIEIYESTQSYLCKNAGRGISNYVGSGHVNGVRVGKSRYHGYDIRTRRNLGYTTVL